MKISLVVASGVHKGKAIPIGGSEFVVGRDEGCQLRPASPAVSKRHCAISIRDGKFILTDFGSTNGTFVNDVQVNQEVELKQGDRVKIGPLDFSFEVAGLSDSTPLPDSLKSLPVKDQKAGSSATGTKPAPSKPADRPTVPFKAPAGSGDTTATTAAVAETKTPDLAPVPPPKRTIGEEDDSAAAMLLGMGDDDPVDVPEGSTVMDIPAVDPANPNKPGEKKDDPKKAAETSSTAAASLLSKYMRRPNK